MRNGGKRANGQVTSTEAAELLGVSTATIKRWSDQGFIGTVRTPGRHRRFLRADVMAAGERLLSRMGPPPLVDLLLEPADVLKVQAQLHSEFRRLGSWREVAEACISTLSAVASSARAEKRPLLSLRIAQGVLEEAVLRCADELPVRAGAPRVLLATAQPQLASVHVALRYLCLRASSWTVYSTGEFCRPEEIASFVRSGAVRAVVLLASIAPSDSSLEEVIAAVLPVCSQTGTSLVLTGTGPWPNDPSPAVLAATTAELQAWMDQQSVTGLGMRALSPPSRRDEQVS